jgi:hypothetical protein
VARGQAEARFEIDTGGGIMGARAHEAGLAVVFRYEAETSSSSGPMAVMEAPLPS